METPIDSLRLLADLLEQKESELSCFDNERDRQALTGLWELYARELDS